MLLTTNTKLIDYALHNIDIDNIRIINQTTNTNMIISIHIKNNNNINNNTILTLFYS